MPAGVVPKRLAGALSRLGLFALCALASELQQPARAGFLDVVALACCTDLLAALLYLTYTAAKRLLVSSSPQPSFGAAQGMVYVSQQQQRCGARQRPAAAPAGVVDITPSALWYYVYATGVAVFSLSYAITNASILPSLALGCSSTACAMYNGARRMGRCASSTAAKVRAAARLLLPMGLMAIVAGVAADAFPDYALWQQKVRAGWVGAVFPCMAPLLVASCRQSMGPSTTLSGDKLVLFSLPFVAVVSLCYLSLHAPLQQCTVLSASVESYLNGSSPLSLLQLIEENQALLSLGHTRDGVAAIAVWLFAAISVAGALMAFVGAMLRGDSVLSCAACFIAVFCCRRVLQEQQQQTPAAHAAAALSCILALCAIAEYCIEDEPPIASLLLNDGDDDLANNINNSGASPPRGGVFGLLRHYYSCSNQLPEQDEDAESSAVFSIASPALSRCGDESAKTTTTAQ